MKKQTKKTYSLEEANRIIKSPDTRSKPKYSLFDMILLLLYADKEYWIHGKIRFMKEVFLSIDEIFKKEPIQQVVFAHYKFGPYSEDVENIVDDMAMAGFVELEGRGNSVSVKITKKGMAYVEEHFHDIPPTMMDQLKAKRESFDTNPDIKHYTYIHHQEYTDNSVFKKRYRRPNWKEDMEDKEQ